MPAIATLEELKAVEFDLQQIQESSPQEYAAFAALLKKHRKIGYKNICKMLLGEATPEKLKGMG
ncbi:MAG: hypothetical protein JW904_03975 [Spirochaetales bacterium]|nr:hypothetical protein [Spirochaetales bacterium]